jgi:hypothetical protein
VECLYLKYATYLLYLKDHPAAQKDIHQDKNDSRPKELEPTPHAVQYLSVIAKFA